MYGSSCSNGKGRSPRAMSYTSAKGIEQLIVGGSVREIASHVCPADGAVLPDCKDRRLGDAAAVLHPYAPVFDHATLRVAEQRKWQEQLVDHGPVVVDRIDRDPGEADRRLGEAFPVACVRGKLPVAVGSPVSSIEDKQDGSLCKVIGKPPGPAFMVG